ncbi:protein kinase [Nocardioides sp. KC13]|uniref:non-specific serine/threonine protein kinase n=1 Tax=Nocardioides turkmenicus TaxID=2711220 RepID=A0A6M1R2E0_9ACTN|nr:protein kinase [Nocardioides sp. KC13]NGN92851.1 protein kinase [Nocardioides sp. KC13]
MRTRPPIAGRYRLHRLLGRGGMGEVWQAADIRLERWVAVKVVETSADPKVTERFRREALSTTAASHPGTVQVHDVGVEQTEYGSIVYLVMELLPGPTLADRLEKQGRFTVEEASEAIVQVARTLTAVHASGIIHRDIKPSNLVYDGDGRIRVLDFGIAQLANHQAERLTSTRHVMGSLPYISPEQAADTVVGPPSDIYALGCVAFELLTGRAPYAGSEPVSMIYQHVTAPVPHVNDVVTVPAHIDEFVASMMDKDPSRRPTAGEVVAFARRPGVVPAITAGSRELASAPKPAALAAPKAASLAVPSPSSPSKASPVTAVAGVVESVQRTPRSHAAPKPRFLRRRVLGTLLVPVVIALVLGGLSFADALDERSVSSRAMTIAGALPESYELGMDLIFERDALSSDEVPDAVRQAYRQVTDDSIEAWHADITKVDLADTPSLRERVERTYTVLKGIDAYRKDLEDGDKASTEAAAAAYTDTAYELLDFATEMPNIRNEKIYKQVTNLKYVRSAAESLGVERAIMVPALMTGRIDEESMEAMSEARTSWQLTSRSFYADSPKATQKALDKISNGTFADGSRGVVSQNAVVQVINDGSLEGVVPDLAEHGLGRPAAQVWAEDMNRFIQLLKDTIVAMTLIVADDVGEEHRGVQTKVVVSGMVAVAAFLGALALLAGIFVVRPLRGRRRSVRSEQ